jgi:hypothetical protein
MWSNKVINTIVFLLLALIIFFIFVYESIKYDKMRKIYESDPFDGYIIEA